MKTIVAIWNTSGQVKSSTILESANLIQTIPQSKIFAKLMCDIKSSIMGKNLLFNSRNFLFISLLIFTTTVKSQSPGGVSGEIIWKKESGIDTLVNINAPQNINKFNFNSIIGVTNDTLAYQNYLNEFYSLFVVFKADTLTENTIFEIESGKNTTKMTNEKMYKGNEVDFNKSKVKRGVILTYITREKDYKRKNKITFEDFYLLMSNDNVNNQLLEVVFYPRFITKSEKEKVETYLSIKYGISLEGEKSYINSSNDTIWNYEKNANFNYRVTGIGRDSISNLSQLQSGNAEFDGVLFQYRPIDSTSIKMVDMTTLLWGDNNGNTHIMVDTSFTSDYNKMDRIWKTQLTTKSLPDTISTNLYFDLKRMDIGSNLSINDSLFWLARIKTHNNGFDYFNAEYIKQSKIVDSIVNFENIGWDKDPTYFTLVSSTELFIVHELAPQTCSEDNANKLNYRIVGGMPPYNVTILNNGNKYEMTIDTTTQEVNVQSGETTLSVLDNFQKTVAKSIYVETLPEEDLPVVLASKWFLDKNGETTVLPQLSESAHQQEDLIFEWFKTDELIALGEQINIKAPGEYTLVITSKEGCHKELPFLVEENSQINNAINIYPNPVISGENFNLVYTLDNPTDLQIKIYNINGQLIKDKKFEATQWGYYQDFLKTSGTYLITTETPEGVQTFKIIVK